MLSDIYKKRLQSVVINSVDDMINLFMKDEKTFYFLLMNYYLTKTDIKIIIRYNQMISSLVTLFCMSLGVKDVSDYFSRYVDLSEIPEQLNNIYDEVGIQEARKCLELKHFKHSKGGDS